MTCQKKIVIISALFPPEPVVSARITVEIASLLGESYDVEVIHPRASRPHGFEFGCRKKLKYNFKDITVNNRISSESIIIGRALESLSFGFACVRYLLKFRKQTDIVYMNTWPLFSQWFVAMFCKLYTIPYVIHIQDVYPESLGICNKVLNVVINRPLIFMDRLLLSNAYRVVSISDKMKSYLVKTRNLREDNVVVVYNWQDSNVDSIIDSQANKMELTNNEFIYLYLGNIGPTAGIKDLIESFAEIKLENVRLIIAGSGSMKSSLVNYVELNKIQNVDFLSVAAGEVSKTQGLADVLVLPMLKGSGLSSVPSKLPAYMFSSKPILAFVDTDSATANSILVADCGWVVGAGNKKELKKKMIEVANIPHVELVKKGSNGLEYGMRYFTKDINLRKLSSVFSTNFNEN